MSSKNIYRIAVIAAMAFGALSCTQNVEIAAPSDVVSFSASTSYKNLPETRTVYSGEEINVSGNAVERIDWVANDDHTDQVAIFNSTNVKSATFRVKDPSSSGTNSNADLIFVSGDEITWASGNNTFLSVYPSTAFNASNKTFGGTLPAVQVQSESHTTTAGLSGSNTSETVTTPTMDDYAFMVAKTVTAKTETVSLDYTLGVTAFEFNLAFAGADAAAPTISKFEMFSTSTPLVGTWSWDGTSFTCPTTLVTEGDNANNMITVNFDAGTTVSATNPLRFTVFALPHDISNLTVKFYLSTGTKTLALKTEGSFDTFDASKKYRITTPGISSGEWVYTLEETTVGAGMHLRGASAGSKTKGIRTYKTHVGEGGGYSDGEQVIVPVKYRYSLADENGENLEDWSDDLPDWLSALQTDYQTTVGGEPEDTTLLTGVFTAIPAQTLITYNQIDTHRVAFGKKGTNGRLTTNPQDLSLYDITNLTSARSSGKPKTANSYVVDRAGWYMFPLVYGNAVDYEMGNATTGWNTMSYTDGTTGWTPWPDSQTNLNAGWVLHTFRNYLNNDIDTPYIIDNVGGGPGDFDVVILWQDQPVATGSPWCPWNGKTYTFNFGDYSEPFINSASIVANPTTSAVYKDADGATKTVPYIKFEVDEDNIREGNAVIALLDNQNRIVWSWHIWVSDTPMTTTTLESRSTVVPSNDILDKPLGFTDDGAEEMFYFSDRDGDGKDIPRVCYVEVTHNEAESTCEPLVFQVTHAADTIYVETRHAVNFYQYGRKDTFFGTDAYRFKMKSGGEMSPLSGNTFIFSKPVIPASGYTITGSYIYDVAEYVLNTVGDVSYGIQHPHVAVNVDQYSDHGSPGGWTHSKNRNLWNMVETDEMAMEEEGASGGNTLRTYDPAKDLKVVKTVYDPCPPGFSVPNFGAFTLFSPTGSSTNERVGLVSAGFAGLQYYADVAQTRTITFPYTNWRQFGGPGQSAFQFFYLTSKSRGQLYATSWQDAEGYKYYSPFGPVSDMSRCNPTAVMAAKEIK